MMFVASDLTVEQPKVKLTQVPGALSEMKEEDHQGLLNYLVSRLKYGNQNRNFRLTRYARIDRAISTWQRLSQKDAKMEEAEDNSGRAHMIPTNLPIMSSHLDDSVSFFAEIFAPHGRDFYAVGKREEQEAAKALATKLNRDTKARKYYKEVCGFFRAMLKYNVGGLAVRFEEGGGSGEMAESGNRIESLDMYNYLYDPSINDVSRIAKEAEWAARVSLKNRIWLVKGAKRGQLQRVEKLIPKEDGGELQATSNSGTKNAQFFRFAPTHVGLSHDGTDDRESRADSDKVNWASYGAALANEEAVEIRGYEATEMYCWLNANEFGLDPEGAENQDEEQLTLWRFIIVDASQVVFAERIDGVQGQDAEIPHYLGFFTADDMKEAQRSPIELIRPFQRILSFLMNVYVLAARKNLWGIKGYDPSMFDMSSVEQGDVASTLKSKVPGRDVRTGLMTLDSSTGVDQVFESMGQVLNIMRSLYPSQAIPSQIAGIDRAVKNQVSVVLQGAVRRLHMTARVVDADVMNPLRLQCYRNLAIGDPEGLDGLTEEAVAKILSSGLGQLNSEIVLGEIKEMLNALIQNPESAQSFDMPGLMSYWSRLLNSPADLGEFVREQQPAPQPGGPTTPGEEGQAPGPIASEAMAAQ